MSELEDVLFQLIRSLTPAEKRHFSLYASRHTIGDENNSLRMFQKLERLKRYNEKKFLKKHEKEEFAKHYSFNKHFLYKLILRSLHSFHGQSTMEARLREQVHGIAILVEKGLFGQARTLIKSVRKKAEKYQFHDLLITLLNQEMAIDREEGFVGKTKKDIWEYRANYEAHLLRMKEQAELESITAQTAMLASQSGLLRDKKIFDELHKLRKDQRLQKQPGTFYGDWHFYSAKVGIHFLTLQPEKALVENELLLKAMEEYPHLIAENPRHYLMSLNNSMVMLSNLKRYDDMLAIGKKMENVTVRSQALKNRKFNTRYGLVLQMYVKTGEFKRAFDLLKEADRMLENEEVQFLNQQFELTHYLAAANIYYALGEFQPANRYLQQIIDKQELTQRSDILCFALILRMIVQYEMQKQDLLEYTVRSAYRFLYKRDKLYRFEGIILDFIRKRSPHLDTRKKQVEAFKDLHAELLPLTKDPYERNAFAYFDIMSWLESKIDEKPYAEIVHAKYKPTGQA